MAPQEIVKLVKTRWESRNGTGNPTPRHMAIRSSFYAVLALAAGCLMCIHILPKTPLHSSSNVRNSGDIEQIYRDLRVGGWV